MRIEIISFDKKVKAIQALREIKGYTLQEAKEAIEGLEKEPLQLIDITYDHLDLLNGAGVHCNVLDAPKQEMKDDEPDENPTDKLEEGVEISTNENEIKTHDFELAKNEIKKFSDQTPTDLNFSKVNDRKTILGVAGDFILGRGLGTKHNVTGDELNSLIVDIQDYFQNVNEGQIRLIKEFGQVYNALEALDKDYIQGILISIKATEETSEGLKKANERTEKIVKNQVAIIDKLKEFKESLEALSHLEEVDVLWEKMESQGTSLNACKVKMESQEAALSDCKAIVEDIQIQLDDLIKIEEKIEAISHIDDVDTVWNKVEKQSIQISDYQKELKQAQCDLHDAKSLISIVSKRIKYAYWIAGGSATLAIIELILLMTKVF